jgi:hypothetical protein
MADTALTIITDALLDLGVLADEETPTASQANGGLRKLNNLIDAWNIDNLLLFGAQENILPLIANKQNYTIGPGGDLDIARPTEIGDPVYIRDMTLPDAQRYDQPTYVYNDQEWADVLLKGQTAPYPYLGVWFEQGTALITAHVTAIPTSSQYSLVFWTQGLIANLALTDIIVLPPGYKRALTANLCIELAGSYGVQVPDTVALIAQDSLDNIRVNNVQINELVIDPQLQGNSAFDWRTGYNLGS